jgi:hypothetical protein
VTASSAGGVVSDGRWRLLRVLASPAGGEVSCGRRRLLRAAASPAGGGVAVVGEILMLLSVFVILYLFH